MIFIDKIKSVFTRSTSSNPSKWLVDWISGGSEASSGVKVNEESALKFTPFWAAVRVISGTMASLPFQVYKRIPSGGKEKVPNHKVYELLHNRPNPYMDAITFIETRMAHVLTYGNGYAEIQRDGAGRPVALWPLLPDRTTRKVDNSGVPYYEVMLGDGSTVNIPDYNVLHIKGLGFDGYTGYNVVDYHKEAIGYGVAVKEYGARFFGQDANPGGVLEYPNALSDNALKHLQESWTSRHSGLSNSHRIQVLEEGAKFNPIGVNPDKAQALEVQQFSVTDCARIFNIPPHKLAELTRATFSNIEELQLEYVTDCLLYWFRKWESEVNYKLFMPSEQKKFFAEVLVDAMLRGNLKDRYASYATARQWGFLSVNDIRSYENLNPVDNGDIYLQPMNMVPAGTMPEEDDDSNINPDAESEFKNMLKEQFKRVVTKQGGKKYDVKQREWAYKIMISSVRALVSVMPNKSLSASNVLSSTLEKYINEKRVVTDSDAEFFADELIGEIKGSV